MTRPWQLLVGCSQQCAGQCGWWIVLRRSDKATWHYKATAGPSPDNLVINTGHWTSYTFISQCVRHRTLVLHSAQHGPSMDTSDTTYRCTICLDTVLFQLINITGSVSGLYSVFLETWKTTFFIWPGSNFWPGSVSASSA